MTRQLFEVPPVVNLKSPGIAVKRIDLHRVAVALKNSIKHASFSRIESENIVVRVELSNGQVGHGEGVPRPYVTGETVDSAFDALTGPDWSSRLGRSRSFFELVQRLQVLELDQTAEDPRGMDGNAARCALELALLDAYGRAFGEPVSRAVDIATIEGLRRFPGLEPRPVRYGVAITAESRFKELEKALRYRIWGFRDLKAKVGVAGQEDAARIRGIRRILGRRIDLRIDANEAWSADELLAKVAPLRPWRISALEQPVPHAEVEALAGLRPHLGIPVMLDESLCGYPDATAAIESGTADLFNVRLSKCGGILPSLRIIGLARRNGLGVQLGCHPGETAILSAAGRQVAGRVDGLRHVEGSYDRYILRKNLSRRDITFGYGGRAKPLRGPGLGIEIDPDALGEMTTERRELIYD